MTTIYEILICLDSSWQIQREIREYKMIESKENDNRHGNSFTASRKGSIGTYTLYENAFDKQIQHGNGLKFFTTEKKNLKEYGKILDDHMEKYLDKAIKLMTKHKESLGSSWEKTKKTNNKAEIIDG